MQYLLDPAIVGSVIDWEAIDCALQALELRSQPHRTSKMVVQFYCLTYEWETEVRRLRGTTGWLPRFEQAGVIEFASDEGCYTCRWEYGLIYLCANNPICVTISSKTSVLKSLRNDESSLCSMFPEVNGLISYSYPRDKLQSEIWEIVSKTLGTLELFNIQDIMGAIPALAGSCWTFNYVAQTSGVPPVKSHIRSLRTRRDAPRPVWGVGADPIVSSRTNYARGLNIVLDTEGSSVRRPACSRRTRSRIQVPV